MRATSIDEGYMPKKKKVLVIFEKANAEINSEIFSIFFFFKLSHSSALRNKKEQRKKEKIAWRNRPLEYCN